MPEFLNLLPPIEALILLQEKLPPPSIQTEWMPLAAAHGRISAQPVIAPEDLPGFPRSTVDGYAVRAADTFGASDSLPAYLKLAGEVPMGSSPQFNLSTGMAAVIHTGGMLPVGADGVVMLEMTQLAGESEVEILKAIGVGENVLKQGEDVRAGSVVLPAGKVIRPAEIGGLAALGILKVPVVKKPLVGIISSGDEVVDPACLVQSGQVRDVNTSALAALVEQAGAQPISYGISPDREELLFEKLTHAHRECDLVVITAGSSASSRDLTARVIQRTGKPGVLVHGVNVRPGKPTILAVCDEKAVIGLPGNPVSALVIAQLFVVPIIDHLLGKQPNIRTKVSASLTINLASAAGREDYVPVRLIQSVNGLNADPIFYKSNLIFSLVQADGLAIIPGDATGIAAGGEVDVILL